MIFLFLISEETTYKDHNEVNTSNNYQLKVSVNHQVNSLMDGGLINDK